MDLGLHRKVRWRARHVVACTGRWMERTLRCGHETARLDGTAASDGTADLGCGKHYAGLRVKEVMIAVES